MTQRFIIDRVNLAKLGFSQPNIETFSQLAAFAAAQSAINQAQTDITEAATNIAALQTDVDALETGVGGLPLLIPPQIPIGADDIDEALGSTLAEYIRDTMGVALVAGTNITVTVNDAGDTITIAAAAAAASAMELISEQTPSGTGLVTFSGIAATYRDLLLVVRGRGTTAATLVAVNITLNNDTGSNYDRERVSGVNVTASASAGTAANNLFSGSTALPAASATAAVSGAIEVRIFDYRGSTFQKQAHAFQGAKTGTTAADLQVSGLSGWWRSVAAVNRVDVTLGAGNFEAGSTVSLYGIL